MNKNISIIITIIVVILVFSGIFTYGLILPPIPQQTIDQIASAYLNAVQRQDLRTLNRLCLPDNIDCNNEMPDRLRMYTGMKLNETQISYHPTESSLYWGITIHTKATNAQQQTISITDSFDVRKIDEDPIIPKFLQDRRWYITIPPKKSPSTSLKRSTC